MKSTLFRLLSPIKTEIKRVRFRYRHPENYQNCQAIRNTNDINADYSLKEYDKYKCIFVRIPKCASRSISKSLFGNLGGGHRTISKYSIIFSQSEFKNYFKFTFVRNPWDRLVSAYHFLREGGIRKYDQEWSDNLLNFYPNFDTFLKEWVNRVDVSSGLHFKPQYEFICDKDHQIMVDFVGYFENLEDDFNYVKNKLGINSTLASLNKTASRKKDYRSYYTDDTAKLVADVYRDDIRIFGYDFDNSNFRR